MLVDDDGTGRRILEVDGLLLNVREPLDTEL